MSEAELRDASLSGKDRDDRTTAVSLPERLSGSIVHFLSYHFVLKRQKTTEVGSRWITCWRTRRLLDPSA